MFQGSWKRRLAMAGGLLFLAGCASFNRGCSSFSTETFGGDWMIVQFSMDGTPFNCWKLENVSLTTDANGGGELQWLDTRTGTLMHVNGWHNQAQVSNGGWDAAAEHLGVEASQCDTGRYPAS